MSWGIVNKSVQRSRRWQFGLSPGSVAVGGSYRLHSFWRSSRRALAAKQVVAITGCDSGLGYSLALHCRKQGATVVAGVLHQNGLAVQDLGKQGVRVLALDVTKEDSVQNFSNELKKMMDNEGLELRGLVNNAGVMIFGEFEWQLPKQAKYQIEVNVLGAMSLTKKLLPELRKHNSRIINVTSHCALAALPGLAVYGATKAALQAWSDALRLELAKYGVSVVNFIPGSFPLESNIFSQQSRQFDDMRAGMSDEMRHFYGDYFERYTTYLKSLPKVKGLRRLGNSKVYEAFDAALLSQRPSAIYKCEPWRYTFYHTLFRITPMPLRDWLILKFMSMPSWTPGKR